MTTLRLLILPLLLTTTQCSNDDPVPSAEPGTRPTLGILVDRAGRAGTSIMLVHLLSAPQQQAMERDRYNQTRDPNQWGTFTATIAENLAIFDGLDGTCANQRLADQAENTAAGRYNDLAQLFANDRLFINSATGICGQYLALESGATADCGGRTPNYDAIDVTYSLMVGGGATVTDGVSADDKTHSAVDFPFLAAPN